MKSKTNTLLTVLSLIVCSSMIGITKAETVSRLYSPHLSHNQISVAVPKSSYEPIETRESTTQAENFNSQMAFLADQLDRNRDDNAIAKPIVVTSFGDLDNLDVTSPVGRLISEQLIHELKVRGWSILDIRLAKSISVLPTGEFSQSRDLSKIRDSLPVGAVVTGTYLRTTDGILVSARVVDVTNAQVLSSGQTRLLPNKFNKHLSENPMVYPTIKVTR